MYWDHGLNTQRARLPPSGKSYGRSGGPVIEYDGHLYRYAQDCSRFYGEKVHMFKILTISRNSYVEEKSDVVFLPSGGSEWNGERTHHIHATEIDGQWIALVDGDDRPDKSFYYDIDYWFSQLKLLMLAATLSMSLALIYSIAVADIRVVHLMLLKLSYISQNFRQNVHCVGVWVFKTGPALVLTR